MFAMFSATSKWRQNEMSKKLKITQINIFFPPLFRPFVHFFNHLAHLITCICDLYSDYVWLWSCGSGGDFREHIRADSATGERKHTKTWSDKACNANNILTFSSADEKQLCLGVRVTHSHEDLPNTWRV